MLFTVQDFSTIFYLMNSDDYPLDYFVSNKLIKIKIILEDPSERIKIQMVKILLPINKNLITYFWSTVF
jgi:hypothetical protein